MIVKYEQLTEDEQALMWKIWNCVEGGYLQGRYKTDENTALLNLQNFGLVYGAFGKYHFTKEGQLLMVKRKLADREHSA